MDPVGWQCTGVFSIQHYVLTTAAAAAARLLPDKTLVLELLSF